jgi:hypothetical protein
MDVPSIERQKMYIVDNANVLDTDTKLSILEVVSIRYPKSSAVFLTAKGTGNISINLDKIELNKIILHIYNIVRGRIESLGRPIQHRQ